VKPLKKNYVLCKQLGLHHCSSLSTHISKEHALLVKKYEVKRDLEIKGILWRGKCNESGNVGITEKSKQNRHIIYPFVGCNPNPIVLIFRNHEEMDVDCQICGHTQG
jgi:hypothetical protein